MSPAEGRKFGLTVGGAFIVLSAVVWWRGHAAIAGSMAGLGALLVLAGLVIPTLLGPVNRAWMGLAHLISKVTTPLFMGIVYYIVLMPFGLVRRALGKNALIAPTSENGGHWVTREQRPAISMQRQF